MKTVKEIPKAQENQAPCGIFLSVATVNIIPDKMRIQIQNAISIPPKTNANKSGQIHDSLQQKCTTAVIREVVMSMTVATTIEIVHEEGATCESVSIGDFFT